MKFDLVPKASMKRKSVIVFVCEHGAAKSILAAAFFNRLAGNLRLDLRAIARGTNPDKELSPQVIKGLSEAGLAATESSPQTLTQADLQYAQRIITFCDLPVEYEQQAIVERWADIPPVSENYEQARDVIVERIRRMFNQ